MPTRFALLRSQRYRSTLPPSSRALLNGAEKKPRTRACGSARRCFNSNTKGRFVGLGNFIWKASLGGVALYVLSSDNQRAADVLRQVDEHVERARVGANMQTVIENLESAWTSVRKIPDQAFTSDVAIKALSIAIWLSHWLERSGFDHKAYVVLRDAADLYEKQIQRPLSAHNGSMSPETIAEKRFILSIFTRLACMAERFEPKAERKWVSLSTREMMPLFPLCSSEWRILHGAIGIAQQTELIDVTLPGLPLEPPRPDLHPYSGTFCGAGLDMAHNNPYPFDTTEERWLYMPFWFLPDLVSAIAVPFERLGVIADKQGNLSYALAAYRFAGMTINQSLDGIHKDNATPEHWEALLRRLKIENLASGAYLRRLLNERREEECRKLFQHADENTSITLDEASEAFMLLRHREKQWTSKKAKVEDSFIVSLQTEFALAVMYRGFCLEKQGEISDALYHFEYVLQDRREWQTNRIHAFDRIRDTKEILPLLDHIKLLKEKISKGEKTSGDFWEFPLSLLPWWDAMDTTGLDVNETEEIPLT